MSRTRTIRAVEIKSKSGSSFETVSFLTFIGRITAAIPTRSRTLMILLPMTLPSKMSVLLLKIEEKETASSGTLVPKATIVRPIKSLLTLKCEATEEAPSIRKSAPLIKQTKPTMRSMICIVISMFVF